MTEKRRKSKRKAAAGPRSSSTTEWRRLEQVVAEIQKELAPQAVVVHNAKVVGRSGRTRQIDVSVSQTIGGLPVFIVIECKRYTRPVGIDRVESFVTKLRDVNASIGVMVSSKGFDAGARAVASSNGVILKTLRQAELTDWSSLMGATSWFWLTTHDVVLTRSLVRLGGQTADVIVPTNVTLFDDEGRVATTEFGAQLRLRDVFFDFWKDAPRPRPIGTMTLRVDEYDPPFFLRTESPSGLHRVDAFELTCRLSVMRYAVNLSLGSGHVLRSEGQDTPEYLEVTTSELDWHKIRRTTQGVHLTEEQWNEMETQTKLEFQVDADAEYKFTFVGGSAVE